MRKEGTPDPFVEAEARFKVEWEERRPEGAKGDAMEESADMEEEEGKESFWG